MYSNTIYILNNTIIECFDIAFNKRKIEKKKPKRKISFVCYSRLEKEDMMVTPTCFVFLRELYYCTSGLSNRFYFDSNGGKQRNPTITALVYECCECVWNMMSATLGTFCVNHQYEN